MLACNHPILVSKDYKQDAEALEPKAAKKDIASGDVDADDLAMALGQLSVTARKCQVCTTEYALLTPAVRISTDPFCGQQTFSIQLRWRRSSDPLL